MRELLAWAYGFLCIAALAFLYYKYWKKWYKKKDEE